MKILKKIAAVAIAAMLSVPFAALGASAAAPMPKDLVVLGDSISTGYGLSGSEDTAQSFANLLRGAFSLDDAHYQNLAVNGATSADLLKSLPDDAKDLAGADTVMVTIGGNDLLGVFYADAEKAFGLPADATTAQLVEAMDESSDPMGLIGAQLLSDGSKAQLADVQKTYADNLSKIAAQIKSESPSAEVYIQTIYNPFDWMPKGEALTDYIDSVVTGMNGVIENGAAAGGYKVIDTYSLFKGDSLDLTNISWFDFHPNEAGHYAIFKAAYAAITGEQYVAPTGGSSSTGSSSTGSSSTGSQASGSPTGSGVPGSSSGKGGNPVSPAGSGGSAGSGTGAASGVSGVSATSAGQVANPDTGAALPVGAAVVFVLGAAACAFATRRRR